MAMYAETKKFDPTNYAGLRLVVDQFDFARQVQTACDTAKLGASRLTGKDAPKQDDTEGPVLLAGNHPNSLIDMMLLLVAPVVGYSSSPRTL